MHAKVHLFIARSWRLPKCNSLDDKSRNAQENSTYIFCDAKICTSPYIIIGAVLTDLTLQMQGYYTMSHEILYNSMILTVHTNWEYKHYNTLMNTI